MNKIVRRLRGLLGIGVTWGVLWSAIGAGIGLVIGVVSPEALGWTHPVLEWAIGMGLYGLMSGVGFGSLLSLGEGRKTVLNLSLRRATIWGVLGAAGVPLLFGFLGMLEAGTTAAEVVGAILVTGVLGGTFAPASIAIARRAELSAVEGCKLLPCEPGGARTHVEAARPGTLTRIHLR